MNSTKAHTSTGNQNLARRHFYALRAHPAALFLHLMVMMLVLSACGGSSSGSGITPAPPAPIPPAPPPPDPTNLKFSFGGVDLKLALLDDALVQFRYQPADETDTARIDATVMVANRGYDGPDNFEEISDSRWQTGELQIDIDPQSLCFAITDRENLLALAEICPDANPGDIRVQGNVATHLYGLGQNFVDSAQFGDLTGRQREPGIVYGNRMVGYAGGAVGNTQIPMLIAMGNDDLVYGLFLDVAEAQTWDLRTPDWTIETSAASAQGYFLAGADATEIRTNYLALTGRPPVPPRKAFGLWVSEYGFDDWAEGTGKLETLRAAGFPVDGLVLDLQWFGGIGAFSQMGSLDWDTQRFPDPAQTIAAIEVNSGAGIIVIEESYIADDAGTYADLEQGGYLVRRCAGCSPVRFDSWWGSGSMIDWSNESASTFWHDMLRLPLIGEGVLGHWTDLGEPEDFDASAWYAGGPGMDRNDQTAIHNLYNFFWSKSIADGYARDGNKRPFILSRSGTAGSQRFGVAMWSGDIGSNFASLAAQSDAHMHMSMSGIDYYGSDIAGFHRGGITPTGLDALYTRWFAASAMLDVPVRPHTENLCNCKETAPDRVGDVASNRANLWLRYALSPYYYSLAHRAWLAGEAVTSPLALHYGADNNTRDLWDHKMIGRDLLTVMPGDDGDLFDVYLPAGRWLDHYTGAWTTSDGRWQLFRPAFVDGVYRLPLYVRAGAIVPQMHVDDQTMNVFGRRADGSNRDELIVAVYADTDATEFTLYEDDGVSTAYQSGQARHTVIRQQQLAAAAELTIGAAQGSYVGALTARNNEVRLFVEGQNINQVLLDGIELPRFDDPADFEAAERGWHATGTGHVTARTGIIAASLLKSLRFEFE